MQGFGFHKAAAGFVILGIEGERCLEIFCGRNVIFVVQLPLAL
jgi:hypothetical protein